MIISGIVLMMIMIIVMIIIHLEQDFSGLEWLHVHVGAVYLNMIKMDYENDVVLMMMIIMMIMMMMIGMKIGMMMLMIKLTSTPSLLRAALTLDGWDSSNRLTITW